MKKLIFIMLIGMSLVGFGQQNGKFRYLQFTRMLYSGTDSLISPADSVGEYNYMKLKDPVDSLDAVNLRFLEDTLSFYSIASDSIGVLFDSIAAHRTEIDNLDDSLDYYVPYTGATGDVNLGANSINTDSVKIGGNHVKLSFLTSGSLGASGYLPVGAGTTTVPAWSTINQAIGNNALTNTYVPYFQGTYLSNSPITTNGTNVFLEKLIGGSATTSDLYFQTTSGVGTTGADMHFLVGNNGGTEAMTILNSGNIGISVASPTTKLDIAGSSEAPTGTYYGIFRINTNTGSNDVGYKIGALAGDGTDGYGFLQAVHTLVSNDANFIINPSGGLVGIRTTLPSKSLEINNATGNNLRLTYNDSNGGATYYADFSTSSSGDLTILPSGGDIAITGNLAASKKVAAQDSLCLRQFRFIIRLDTLCSVVGTDTLRIHPPR